MKMKIQTLVRIISFLLFYCSIFSATAVAAESTEEQCSNDFTKVAMCLNYATGKAASPSDECCTNVKDISNEKPVCLCYVILQAHKGQSSLKNLGVQEAKLLQLPTACKLPNATVSDCPKLLNITSSSPDYAVFTNTSSPATPTTATSLPTNDSSIGFVHRPHIAGLTTIAMAITIFISLFPTGLISLLIPTPA